MINQNYTIDSNNWFDEGGSCQVYHIKNYQNLIFKEFKNRNKAQESYKYHKKLAKFDLAPTIHSELCRLKFSSVNNVYYILEPSNWGYITEFAATWKNSPILRSDIINLRITIKDIQCLVDEIYTQTGLEFWDCHWYNVGFVERNLGKKIVCIDTGKESFKRDSNQWGLNNPGPICNKCNQFAKKCYC